MEKKKKSTIYEVAEKVGVSISTVSRVLNDSPNVSDRTKEKVNKVIEELNYTPQVMARKLASSQPQMLAIVVPSFTTPYFNEVLKGIKDELSNVDLDLVMYNTGSRAPQKGIQNFFDRGMADAVIVLSINIEEEVHKLLQSTQTPAVLVNSSHPDYNYFKLNDYKGGYLAGEHLASQGFNSIGMLLTAKDSPTISQRKRGFTDALKKHNVKIDNRFFVRGDSTKHSGFTEEAGYEAIYKLDKKEAFPEALFCANDTMALGAMHALSKLGMNVPEDIAIMGYDNIKSSKYLDLTTIDQRMHNIGTEAINRLTQLLKHPEGKLYQTTIDPVLVARGSTVKK